MSRWRVICRASLEDEVEELKDRVAAADDETPAERPPPDGILQLQRHALLPKYQKLDGSVSSCAWQGKVPLKSMCLVSQSQSAVMPSIADVHHICAIVSRNRCVSVTSSLPSGKSGCFGRGLKQYWQSHGSFELRMAGTSSVMCISTQLSAAHDLLAIAVCTIMYPGDALGRQCNHDCVLGRRDAVPVGRF